MSLLKDSDFLASMDVDAGGSGLGAIGATSDVIPGAVIVLLRQFAGNFVDGGSLLEVFNASSSIDFAISPADGVGGRELVVAASMGDDVFDVLKCQGWVGLQPQGDDAAHHGAGHGCAVQAVIRITLPLHRLGKCGHIAFIVTDR